MSLTGDLPHAPPFRLAAHGLAMVLCQVRFSPVLRIRQDAEIVAFQDAIRAAFPRYASQHGVQLLVTPTGVQQQEAADAQHRFDTSDGSYTAVLTPEFVALETRDYADIDALIDRLHAATSTVQEHFGPSEHLRIGLRFINELRLTRTTNPWDEVRSAIRPDLLGATDHAMLRDVVTSAEQALELRSGDDRLVVRHGLYPGGGTTLPPTAPSNDAPLHQPFYLLDLDAFTERAGPFAPDAITSTVRRFNDDIRTFFAWAVREEYRTTSLGQQPS
ncbi:MAG: TIGR04255 family protein [Solirubrobacteraceae bacterium]